MRLTLLARELMSAAVGAADNHVLRGWLRRVGSTSSADVATAMNHVVGLFSASADNAGESDGTVVSAFCAGRGPNEVLPVLRDTLSSLAPPTMLRTYSGQGAGPSGVTHT